jgi:hypothetical protein
MCLIGTMGYRSNAMAYTMVNKGKKPITIDLIFESAFVHDWENITVQPQEIYRAGKGAVCLRGIRLVDGGVLAGEQKGYVAIQDCSSLKGPGKIDQIIFNQHDDGRWMILAGRGKGKDKELL